MKNFINKISKGSKWALFLEILLLVQILGMIYMVINPPIFSNGHFSKYK